MFIVQYILTDYYLEIALINVLWDF